MAPKRRNKWKIINKRVKKHITDILMQDIENNESDDFQESITSEYPEISLHSDLSEDVHITPNFIYNRPASEYEYQSINSDIDFTVFETTLDISDNEICSLNNCSLPEDNVNKENYNIQSVTEYTYSNIKNDLSLWGTKFRISHIALNDLLCILKKYDNTLPSDARTLLKTERKSFVSEICNGTYIYFGIATNLKMLFSKIPMLKLLQKVELLINIDGLPISDSSSTQFWPILCKISQSICKVEPFIIAVYCGQSKPNSVDEYLKDFIQEYKILCNSGLVIDSKLYAVSIVGFICDAPARAFVKVIKGHTGYYGCERCTQKGIHPFGATIFNEVDAESRTNASFLSQKQLEHHNGISPLIQINFPMVTGFILDSMHLVYLGVVKRILLHIVKGNNYYCKIDARNVNLMSNRLELLHENIPLDFVRKPQSLNKIKHWKATELRQFILYTGIFVFNGIVSNKFLDHLKILHVAIFILSNPNIAVQLCDYVQSLLIIFVKHFDDYFGPGSNIYNVHNLIHMPDDVRNFGKPLDDISAFDFENLLGKIKRLLRCGKKPLSQLSRRLSENIFISSQYISTWQLKRKHKHGPLLFGMENSTHQYKEIIFDKYHFITNRKSDCYTLLKNGSIVQIFNIVSTNLQEIHCIRLICKQFLKYDSYFSYPCDSRKLKIFRISELETEFKIFSILEVEAKYIVLKDNISYIAYPLLHTISKPE